MAKTPRNTFRRRLARGVGRGLLVLATAVAMLVLALMLAPVRGWVLDKALSRVGATLPGSLTWERAAWPGPGRLELEGLTWTDAGDTMLAASHLRVAVALGSLRHHDLEVTELTLDGLRVDVPAVQAHLPASTAAAAQDEGGSSFFRDGALPGVPSLAVTQARLAVDRVDLGADRTVRDALLQASLELRAGHDPAVRLDSLRVAAAPGGWSVPDGRLTVSPGATSGRLRAVSSAQDTLALDVARAGADSFTVELHAVGTAQADLSGRGVFGRRPLRTGLQLSGRAAGRDLRTLELSLAATDSTANTLHAALRVGALGWTASTEADVARGDSLWVSLAPIVVTADTSTAHSSPTGADGRLTVRDGVMNWRDVRVLGDLGDWRLNGSRDGDHLTLDVAADLPGPARFLASRPELKVDDWTDVGLDLLAEADLGGAQPVWSARLDLARTSWLRAAHLTAHGSGPAATIDELVLALPGLRAAVSGAASPEALDLRGHLDLTDASTLQRVVELPADLTPRGRADFRVTGTPEAPHVDLRTRARVSTPAWDLGLAASAGVTAGDSLTLKIAPLVLVEGRDAPAADGPRRGRVVVSGDRVRFRDLQLTGDFGTVTLTGRRGALVTQADLSADWPVPPPALDRRLGERTIAWSGATATAAVRLEPSTPGGAHDRGRVTAALDLPGPASLAALAPDVRLDDLTSLLADLEADFQLAPAGPTWHAALDFMRTPWLESGRLAAHGAGGETVLDSLTLALPGLSVTGTGLVATDSLALDGVIALPDAVLLARLPAVPDWSDLELRVEVAARGAPAAPRLTGDLVGRVATPQVTAPELTGSFLSAPDSFRVALTAPQGLTAGLLTWDRVEVVADGADPAAAMRVRLDATGEALGVALQGALTRAPSPILEMSAFRLVSDGRDLSLEQPFRVERRGAGWWMSPLAMTGEMGRVQGGGVARPDSLDLTLDADVRLPLSLVRTLVPQLTLPSDRSLENLALTGDLFLRGTPAAPRLGGSLGAAVRGDKGPADLAFLAQLDAAPGRTTANLRLTRKDRLLAKGDAVLPAVFSLDPPSFAPSADDSFRVTLRTEPMDLADLADYMPPDLRVKGAFTAAVDLRGVGRAAVLGGFVDAPSLRISLQDQSWLTLGGRVDLGGTSQRPSVRGALTVTGGVVVIPDVPPPLLPADGRALLLEKPQGEAAADSAVTVAAPTTPSLDLDLRLNCPGDLWLRGRGLSLQLAGDLRATVRDDEPAVVGELRTVEGTYRFLGTLFRVERGVVSFYGDLEADPRLDLELTSTAGGTVYRIAMQGWALAPELHLSSEPEMTEGDIVASLLFGKPLDQLDSGQEDLLKARTAQVLTSLGATRISDRLSRALGADLVAYNQGSADSADSLMLGKYLSPRLLLKYEQFLDRRSSYYVRLDYALSRFFRLETSVGQGDESGVELKWARDY